MAELLGANHINLGIFDPLLGTAYGVAPRTDPAWQESYSEYWARQNPLWLKTGSLPVGQIFTPRAVMEPDEFIETAFYQEWWRPVGLGLDALATNILLDGDASGVMSVYSGEKAEDFDRQDYVSFANIALHVSQAIALERRLLALEGAAGAMLEALDRLDVGVAILSHDAHLLAANLSFESLLNGESGVAVVSGKVTVQGLPHSLEAILNDCSRRGALFASCSFVRREIEQGMGRSVQIIPASHISTFDASILRMPRPVACLVIADTPQRLIRLREKLSTRYHLTEAEIALTLEVCRGDGKAAAAARRGVTYATARSQLVSIFEKTGVHRQAELVKLLQEFS
ncbi:MAG: hypothetical protein ABGW87_06845 [Sphingomonadaceae bacterium]